jgi:hypothetical protein
MLQMKEGEIKKEEEVRGRIYENNSRTKGLGSEVTHSYRNYCRTLTSM